MTNVDYVSRFFFFQAEDGIRDYKVTGVQTCALPIWNLRRQDGQHHGLAGLEMNCQQDDGVQRSQAEHRDDQANPRQAVRRSEEHTSELQSPCNLVCRLLLEKKKNTMRHPRPYFEL